MPLEKGANQEAVTEDGEMPLNLAVFEGYVGVVQLLLGNRANKEAAGMNGLTPLLQAVSMGCVKVVKILQEKKVNTEALTKKDETPLQQYTKFVLDRLWCVSVLTGLLAGRYSGCSGE